MIRTILKGALLAATVLSATTAVAPAVAQDYGDPMYERYHYDDAAMTQQVGYEQDTCNRYGVGGGRTQGRYGPYVQENLIAYCNRGQIYPA